jgi:hypothetical protein
MGIPKECKMPDLSGLDALTNRLLVQVIIGDPGIGKEAALYRRNLVRLVDKAVREYNEARKAILADITERGMYFISFTDHIETCINATARLFKLLERIKSEKEAPAFPRELRRLVETKSKSIANIRDTVEHVDEQIHNGEIAPGQPIMLTVGGNDESIVIGNYEIKFEELAMVLRKIHEIAQYILTIRKAVA